MSILSKVLIGLIFVASLAFFYLAARTLKTHQAWQGAADSYVAPLERLAQQNELLLEGDPTAPADQPKPGIRQLSVTLHGLLIDRGRAWYDVGVNSVAPETGEMLLAVPTPDPHGISTQKPLYIFSAGAYVGKFKVTNVDDAQKTVLVAPSLKPSPRQLELIRATSQNQVALYETMPRDRHGVLEALSQEELTALMPGVPAEAIQEYLRHGQQATSDDPAERVVDGRYQRSLYDYALLFDTLHAQIARQQDQVAAATTDKAIAEQARDAARAQIVARQAKIDNELKPELAEVQSERDLMKKHLEALEVKLAATRTELAETMERTKEMAARWTAAQLQAAERINALAGEASATN